MLGQRRVGASKPRQQWVAAAATVAAGRLLTNSHNYLYAVSNLRAQVGGSRGASDTAPDNSDSALCLSGARANQEVEGQQQHKGGRRHGLCSTVVWNAEDIVQSDHESPEVCENCGVE